MEDLSHSSKEVAKGSFWGLAGQLTYKLISFFYVILIARMAAQEDVGLFYLSFGIIQLITTFNHLGIPGTLVRYVPFFDVRGEKGKVAHLLRLSYDSLLFTGILFVCLLWLSADYIGEIYHSGFLPDAIRMFSAFLLFNNLFSINKSFLQGRADMRSIEFINNMQNLFKLGATLALFLLVGPSVFTMIGGMLLSQLLSILVAFPIIQRRTRDLPAEAEGIQRGQLIGEMLPFGLMLTTLTSFGILLNASDKLLLGYLLPSSIATVQVGIYSVAILLSMVLLIFPMSIGNIFLPVMSRLAGKEDKGSMREVTGTAQRWMLFVAIPIGIVMMAFPGSLLTVLYGEGYAGGAMAMAIFTFGILARTFSTVLSLGLAAMRLVGIELRIIVAGALFNVLMNLLLIPSYGMEGAAAASAMSFVLMSILLHHYAKIHFGYSIHPAILKLFAAGIAAFLIVLIAKPITLEALSFIPEIGGAGLAEYASKAFYLIYIGFLVALSTGVFIATSLLLRCFMKDDIILMRKAMRRAMVPQSLITMAEKVASHGLTK